MREGFFGIAINLRYILNHLLSPLSHSYKKMYKQQEQIKRFCKYCGIDLKTHNVGDYCTSGDRHNPTPCQIIEKKKRGRHKKIKETSRLCHYCGSHIVVRDENPRVFCTSGEIRIKTSCELLHRNKVILENGWDNLSREKRDEVETNNYLLQFKRPRKIVRCLGHLHKERDYYFIGDTANRVCPICKKGEYGTSL
jgi:hypothetical protein